MHTAAQVERARQIIAARLNALASHSARTGTAAARFVPPAGASIRSGGISIRRHDPRPGPELSGQQRHYADEAERCHDVYIAWRRLLSATSGMFIRGAGARHLMVKRLAPRQDPAGPPASIWPCSARGHRLSAAMAL